jgi:hypothetical protein
VTLPLGSFTSWRAPAPQPVRARVPTRPAMIPQLLRLLNLHPLNAS